MKKPVSYLLGAFLALLGFSSCSALREARLAREAREREAFEAQQRALVEQTLREMLEADENDPYRIAEEERRRAEAIRRADSIRRAEGERAKLLYAVPNVPYKQVEIK